MTPGDMLVQCPVSWPAPGVWRELSTVTGSPASLAWGHKNTSCQCLPNFRAFPFSVVA